MGGQGPFCADSMNAANALCLNDCAHQLPPVSWAGSTYIRVCNTLMALLVDAEFFLIFFVFFPAIQVRTWRTSRLTLADFSHILTHSHAEPLAADVAPSSVGFGFRFLPSSRLVFALACLCSLFCRRRRVWAGSAARTRCGVPTSVPGPTPAPSPPCLSRPHAQQFLPPSLVHTRTTHTRAVRTAPLRFSASIATPPSLSLCSSPSRSRSLLLLSSADSLSPSQSPRSPLPHSLALSLVISCAPCLLLKRLTRLSIMHGHA
eukprot:4121210-Pleurochrysis_carterae.AAC.1